MNPNIQGAGAGPLWPGTCLSPVEIFFPFSQIDVYLAKSLAEKLYLFQVMVRPEGEGAS